MDKEMDRAIKDWIRENVSVRVRSEGAGYNTNSKYLTVELCLLNADLPEWDRDRYEVFSSDEVTIEGCEHA